MNDYFLPHDTLIRKIVYSELIKKGYYPPGAFEDLYMDIIEDLIKGESKILGNYRNEAPFNKYLARIVANRCKKLQEKRIHQKAFHDDLIYYDHEILTRFFSHIRQNNLSGESKMILDEAYRRLRYIFDNDYNERDKVIFCLRGFYQCFLKIQDLEGYPMNPAVETQVDNRINNLNHPNGKNNKEKIKELLTDIFNLLEGSNNSKDAIRKWTDDKVKEIIVQLNRPPFRSNFDAETFQILFVKCFDRPEK
jgi:hypothetical protein